MSTFVISESRIFWTRDFYVKNNNYLTLQGKMFGYSKKSTLKKVSIHINHFTSHISLINHL